MQPVSVDARMYVCTLLARDPASAAPRCRVFRTFFFIQSRANTGGAAAPSAPSCLRARSSLSLSLPLSSLSLSSLSLSLPFFAVRWPACSVRKGGCFVSPHWHWHVHFRRHVASSAERVCLDISASAAAANPADTEAAFIAAPPLRSAGRCPSAVWWRPRLIIVIIIMIIVILCIHIT